MFTANSVALLETGVGCNIQTYFYACDWSVYILAGKYICGETADKTPLIQYKLRTNENVPSQIQTNHEPFSTFTKPDTESLLLLGQFVHEVVVILSQLSTPSTAGLGVRYSVRVTLHLGGDWLLRRSRSLSRCLSLKTCQRIPLWRGSTAILRPWAS